MLWLLVWPGDTKIKYILTFVSEGVKNLNKCTYNQFVSFNDIEIPVVYVVEIGFQPTLF